LEKALGVKRDLVDFRKAWEVYRVGSTEEAFEDYFSPVS
jgi:hypothetical protein